MILCLDIGNSHIFGGVFNENNKLLYRFRHATYNSITSDQLGTFLKNVLEQNNIDPKKITAIAFCSVVPCIDYSLKAACKKYFNITPFVLDSSNIIKIKIKTTTPEENGSDIIAGAIAASSFYPKENLIVIDLGTVTTIAAVNKNREYLGVTFIPGIQTAMNSLTTNAAKLLPVEIAKSKKALGKNTIESIQSGLFLGHLGALKEITTRIARENFAKSKPLIIATGGFAHLFKKENIFTHIEPDLVLHGIKLAYETEKNCN